MSKVQKKKRKKKTSSLYKFLLFLEILIIAVFILIGLTIKCISNVSTTPLDESQLVTVNEDINMENYTNIVLFGVDTRSTDLSSEASRSDAIIVASINNSTKEVKLISIYRDSYVSVNGTYTKINHAYAYGGPELAISTINRNYDLNISQYATVNFKIMANIIDALGGIELEVEADFIDDLNKYIKSVNYYNGGNSPGFTSAGTYTFDGNQAVAYARIRHNQNGDISRANRQRIVLKAIMDKAKTHPVTFMKAMNDVLPQIQTNMTTNDLMKMVFSAPLYKIVDQEGFPYDHTEVRLSDGIYYDVPTTLEENVIKLHENLFGTINYQISDELNRINEKIMSQTGYYQ
ncbi:MAG: LCP family protein [Lachnospiraceae bacterium]|nr:LCP family protein [Lachnospiraceae bacterium]